MLDFPNIPLVGQQFEAAGVLWQWDGEKWTSVGTDFSSTTGSNELTVSDTAPTNPASGQLWWDSVSGNLFLWYVDVTSSQWVPAMSETWSIGSGYLQTTGGQMLGPLSLAGNATANLQAVPLQQLNTSLSNYISVTGGTLTGPLIWTATSSTTARSAQNRSRDYVNVLDFGADPTGAADSTAAFNAAIASYPYNNGEVYIPAGSYKITDAINIGAGCVLRGAGRQTTLLSISSAFNMSALGVIVFLSDPAHPGTPTIKDLWIRFQQPNTTGMTRANLIQYPPAIYKAASTATGRPNIENIMISSAWVGMFMDNVAAYLNNIYMSAFSYGFQWSWTTATLDLVRINNVHFWGFDISASSPLGQIFLDGTTNFGWFGRIDGLLMHNCFNESSIMTIDNTSNTGGGYYFIDGQGFDGPAQLIINGTFYAEISNMTNSRGGSLTTPSVTVNGGRNNFLNCNYASSMTATPAIQVNGGSAYFIGGSPWWAETDTPFAVVTNGTLSIQDVNVASHMSVARTTPLFSQSATGALVVTGCNFGGLVGGPTVSFGNANPGSNFVGYNNYNNTTAVLPTTYVTGSWGSQLIHGDATATSGQMSLVPSNSANSQEGKLRLYGTFATGSDLKPRLFSSIRSGSSGSWSGGYLNVWITSTTNDIISDANMQMVANFTQNSQIFGNVASAANQTVAVNGAAATYRSFSLLTNGSARWALQATNTSESGSNAGSDFQLSCQNDSGGNLFTPMTITRSTGNITFGPGNIAFGSNTARANLSINGPVQNRNLSWQTAGLARWNWICNGTAEGGSNTGSDFELDAYDDTGALLGRSILVTRSTGAIAFYCPPGTGMANISSQGFALTKVTAAATAPGAGQARLVFVTGTTAGTAKLVAYAGTSTTPVTIMDNIGTGF